MAKFYITRMEHPVACNIDIERRAETIGVLSPHVADLSGDIFLSVGLN